MADFREPANTTIPSRNASSGPTIDLTDFLERLGVFTPAVESVEAWQFPEFRQSLKTALAQEMDEPGDQIEETVRDLGATHVHLMPLFPLRSMSVRHDGRQIAFKSEFENIYGDAHLYPVVRGIIIARISESGLLNRVRRQQARLYKYAPGT